jgi:hypothetical protein
MPSNPQAGKLAAANVPQQPLHLMLQQFQLFPSHESHHGCLAAADLGYSLQAQQTAREAQASAAGGLVTPAVTAAGAAAPAAAPAAAAAAALPAVPAMLLALNMAQTAVSLQDLLSLIQGLARRSLAEHHLKHHLMQLPPVRCP